MKKSTLIVGGILALLLYNAILLAYFWQLDVGLGLLSAELQEDAELLARLEKLPLAPPSVLQELLEKLSHTIHNAHHRKKDALSSLSFSTKELRLHADSMINHTHLTETKLQQHRQASVLALDKHLFQEARRVRNIIPDRLDEFWAILEANKKNLAHSLHQGIVEKISGMEAAINAFSKESPARKFMNNVQMWTSFDVDTSFGSKSNVINEMLQNLRKEIEEERKERQAKHAETLRKIKEWKQEGIQDQQKKDRLEQAKEEGEFVLEEIRQIEQEAGISLRNSKLQ